MWWRTALLALLLSILVGLKQGYAPNFSFFEFSSAQSFFRMIPTKDELGQLPDRVLQFFPSEVTNPQTFTPEQVRHFNEKGYITGVQLYNESYMSSVREYMDGLLKQYIGDGGTSFSITTAHRRHGRVYDIITDPKIVSFVKDLLGNNVIAHGAHFFCKLPFDKTSVSFHQDASYWPLTPSKTITVWLAVEDVDTKNACMKFVEGTHILGHLTYRKSNDDEHNILDQTVDNAEQFGEIVNIELKAGHASFHSDLLLHGSDANLSPRRRCGLALRYCASDVTASLGWSDKGVVVSGEDVRGHWANPTRPIKD